MRGLSFFLLLSLAAAQTTAPRRNAPLEAAPRTQPSRKLEAYTPPKPTKQPLQAPAPKPAAKPAAKPVAAAKPKPKPSVEPRPVNFQQRIEEYWMAWASGDDKAIKAYYSPDPGAVFFDAGPLQTKGWAQFAKQTDESSTHGQHISVRLPEKVTIQQRGSIVWTTNTLQITIEPPNAAKREYQARHTLIWERRAERWVIAHEHLSVPMAAAQ